MSTGATWESIGWVVTPKPSVLTLEVKRTMGRPARLYSGRLAIPTEELNGPTTPKAPAAMAFLAALTPLLAVGRVVDLEHGQLHTVNAASRVDLIHGKLGARAMSIPVDACSPVMGLSTAMRPAFGCAAPDAAETGAMLTTVATARASTTPDQLPNRRVKRMAATPVTPPMVGLRA